MLPITVHLSELGILLAIVLRLSLVLFMLPLFRAAKYPAPIKVATILALAVVFYPLVAAKVQPLPLLNLGTFAWILCGELILAGLFAFALQVLFGAFQLAGQLIGFQMGIAMAQVMDPSSGHQESIIGGFFNMLVLLVLFAAGGHRLLIKAVVESFLIIPIGSFRLDTVLYQPVLELSGKLFIVGVKVAAPIIVAILLTQLGMGLTAKFAPQINVLIAGFPLTLMIGFFFTGVSFLAWGGAIEQCSREVFGFIFGLLK